MRLNTSELATHPLVDCHAHIFSPKRFPFHASGTYELAPNEIGDAAQYQAVLDSHGVSYGVLINPLGGYGVDNACMLDAIAASGGRLKGIAVVTADIQEEQATDLAQAGVEGIRFSLHHPDSPSLLAPATVRLLDIARSVKWKVLIHYTDDLLVDALPILQRCDVTYIVDHCGRPSVGKGLRQPGFQALLELARSSNAYIKLSGVFRFSCEPWPHTDVLPYVQALIETFGIDRCIWGSDWPFTRMDRRVDYGPLMALVDSWLPDPDDRRKLLSTNPISLFSFE